MERIVKMITSIATAGILAVSIVSPAFADTLQTYEDDELHRTSVTVTAQVRDYVEYRKRALKTNAADVSGISWNDGTGIVKDVLATDADLDAAREIAKNQSSPAFITGRITLDDLSEGERDTYFGAIYSEIRNFSAKNYLKPELDCIVSPEEDMLSDDGSHTVSVRHISRVVDKNGREKVINISIKQPFSYDKSRYRLDSVKAVQAYPDGGTIAYNQLDSTDSRCIYNEITDTLSLKLGIVSPMVILADFHALWADEVYSIIYYDHSGNRYYTQDILGSNIASDRIEPATPPEWEDSRYFHDFKEWRCTRDASTAWDEYVSGGKRDKSLLHIDYHPVYKDPVDKITLAFKLPDGTKAANTIISRPGNVTLPEAPVSGGRYTGAFLGWKSSKTGKVLAAGAKVEVKTANDSDEYTAQYEKWEVVNYEFRDYNGKVLYKEQKKADEPIIIPPNPSRKETEDYAYEFTGWSDPIIDSNGTVVYTALYNQIPKYLITFLDSDKKTVLQQKKYKMGDVPYCPQPSKSGYTFTGWSSKDGVHPVSGEATYIAQYTKNKVEEKKKDDDKKDSDDSGGGDSGSSGGGGGGAYYVNVVFRDYDGRELKKVTVPQGSKLDPPAVPSFTYGGYEFTFSGWVPGQPDTVPYDGYAHGYDTYKASYYAKTLTGSGTTGTTTGTGSSGSKTSSTSGTKSTSGVSAGSSTSKKTATPTPPAKTTSKTTPTPTPSVTPSPWEANWHKTKMSQDEARIRFIPNEYYGNITDFTVFDKDLSAEEKKIVEEQVKKQQEEQDQKLRDATVDKQTSPEEKEEFPEPEQEEGHSWLFWLLIILGALILIAAIVGIFIYFGKKDEDDVYY